MTGPFHVLATARHKEAELLAMIQAIEDLHFVIAERYLDGKPPESE